MVLFLCGSEKIFMAIILFDCVSMKEQKIISRLILSCYRYVAVLHSKYMPLYFNSAMRKRKEEKIDYSYQIFNNVAYSYSIRHKQYYRIPTKP